MFKPFRSHRRLLGWVIGCVLEDSAQVLKGVFLQRDASMRALWSDRQICSHNVSRKLKRIRRLSEYGPLSFGPQHLQERRTFPRNLCIKNHSLLNLEGADTPSTAGTFRQKFRKNSERPRKRSQNVSWNSRREYGWDAPKPYNSRHLRLPEHFQNFLPPSTAGGASFFRSGSGEGLS